MGIITEIENLEYNITWAYNNQKAIEDMGYTIEEYIEADKRRLLELTS